MKSNLSKSEVKFIMSFGEMPMANKFLETKNFKNEKFYDMSVGFDENLSLFQLMQSPDPEEMFDENYAFFSGTSKYMVSHFKNFSNQIKERLKNISEKKKVIEIGCNDGIMLQNFSNKLEYDYLGIEPSKNVYAVAKEKNLSVINDFFTYELALNLTNYQKKTDVIYAANVICHIPDLNNLFNGIEELLNKKGVFIFEEPYLGDVIRLTSYDQIYDEHVYLFSLLSVGKISKLFDLEIIDAYPQITHGGSMRYVIGRKGEHNISDNFKKLLSKEFEQGLDNFDTYLRFKDDCESSKKRLIKILNSFAEQDKKISGYAATSKSTTILNYCKIGKDIINCIYDTTPIKIDKFSPGMHIPIKHHKNFNIENTNVSLLFGWNHKKEIFEKEKNYSRNGGIWLSHISDLL
jgi:methylation protein EvaC